MHNRGGKTCNMLPLRCACRPTRLATRPLALCLEASPLPRRGYTDQSRFPPTRYQTDPDPSPENVQNEFAGHTVSAFKDMRKVILFLAYGTLIVGSVTGVAFEAAHFWIEYKMSERADDDARRWGWEVERWSDMDTGGTSPELGFVGRHAVRAAWFSLHYGQYFSNTATISHIPGQVTEQGSLNFTDASLESARMYLEKAMTRLRNAQGRVRTDGVALELLERHAGVMERLGTRATLAKAKDEYMQVLHGRAGKRDAEARLEIKLGDLSERLGDDIGALTWWMRGIDHTKDETSSMPTSLVVEPGPPQNFQLASFLPWRQGSQVDNSTGLTSMRQLLPTEPPSKPAAQRTLVGALLSLSAYYSKRKQLHKARCVQEHAMQLIESMVPQPASSSGVRPTHSPAQTLHHMYLLHRKALLGLHHGEVTFALASSAKKVGSSPHAGALTDLITAASLSEAVAQILTGLPLLPPDLPSSYLSSDNSLTSEKNPVRSVPHPPSPKSELLEAYRDCPGLSGPAKSLLRDARLAAGEAWNLCGVLYSELGDEDDMIKALECFERALGWVGEDPVASRSREGISAKEWQSLWARFLEARDKVLTGSRNDAT